MKNKTTVIKRYLDELRDEFFHISGITIFPDDWEEDEDFDFYHFPVVMIHADENYYHDYAVRRIDATTVHLVGAEGDVYGETKTVEKRMITYVDIYYICRYLAENNLVNL